MKNEDQAILDGVGVTLLLVFLLREPLGYGTAKVLRSVAGQWEKMPEPLAIFVTRLADWVDPTMSGITGFDLGK